MLHCGGVASIACVVSPDAVDFEGCVLLFADHGAELVCNGIVCEHSSISKVVDIGEWHNFSSIDTMQMFFNDEETRDDEFSAEERLQWERAFTHRNENKALFHVDSQC